METLCINVCRVIPVVEYFGRLFVFLPLKPFLKHLLCVWKVVLWVECIECFTRIHLWELTAARYLTVEQIKQVVVQFEIASTTE